MRVLQKARPGLTLGSTCDDWETTQSLHSNLRPVQCAKQLSAKDCLRKAISHLPAPGQHPKKAGPNEEHAHLKFPSQRNRCSQTFVSLWAHRFGSAPLKHLWSRGPRAGHARVYVVYENRSHSAQEARRARARRCTYLREVSTPFDKTQATTISNPLPEPGACGLGADCLGQTGGNGGAESPQRKGCGIQQASLADSKVRIRITVISSASFSSSPELASSS